MMSLTKAEVLLLLTVSQSDTSLEYDSYKREKMTYCSWSLWFEQAIYVVFLILC